MKNIFIIDLDYIFLKKKKFFQIKYILGYALRSDGRVKIIFTLWNAIFQFIHH